MKENRLIFFLILFPVFCHAQQYSLYNSRTLFDSFENPSQKAFQTDTSRRFAFNFFIPTITANATFNGPAEESFRLLAFQSAVSPNAPFGEKYNILTAHTNNYLFMLRMFKAVKRYQEMGISWQVRNDTYIKASNESFALFSDLNKFTEDSYTGIFNNKGYNLLYHQFSFTYRANYSRRMGAGIKASFLSGMAYNQIRINNSFLRFDEASDQVILGLSGRYRSNFGYQKPGRKDFYPSFKNPGASVSLSANYKFRNRWYVLGNIKDLGFIKWNKKSYEYNFVDMSSATDPDADNADDEIIDDIIDQNRDIETQTSFVTPTNAKAELLLNKDFNHYQPNLILSKNLFYPGGDVALINNYKYRTLVFTLATAYNFNNFFQLGGQLMYKTPNFELFAGTDQLAKTYISAKNFINDDITGTGHTAASFYFGFAVKFGKVLEHRQNATQIPGFEGKKKQGVLKKLIPKKSS